MCNVKENLLNNKQYKSEIKDSKIFTHKTYSTIAIDPSVL